MSGARFWPVVERNPDDSFHDVERVHRRRIHRCRAADPCRVPGPLLRPHPVLPLAPRTARAVDLAVGERCGGPIFCDRIGGRLDRHDVARVVRRIARRAEIRKRVGPHTFVTRSSLQRSPPVSRFAMCKKLPATPIHRPRCATTVPGSHSTGTRLHRVYHQRRRIPLAEMSAPTSTEQARRAFGASRAAAWRTRYCVGVLWAIRT